jgi:beta-phosphoglucomutase-like phosphatase (HAD superfamily)
VPDAESRVDEYAQHKQQTVVALIEAGEFSAFPDAVRLLLDAHAAGIRVATASSSKNARLMLSRLRLDSLAEEYDMSYDFITSRQTLLDLVDLDISGRTFRQGKPHPEIFLTACQELGLTPRTCFVVEDAVAGVTAAKGGGMAALGIARIGDSELLRDAGADLVLTTLDDVDRSSLRDGRLERVGALAAYAPHA